MVQHGFRDHSQFGVLVCIRQALCNGIEKARLLSITHFILFYLITVCKQEANLYCEE